MIQTIPGVEHLVKEFDYNLKFIFFMHFVLRCLHREEDLKGATQWHWVTMPFCKTRHDNAEERRLVAILKRLGEIESIINHPLLNGLIANDEEQKKITGFDPRPDPVIRAQWHQLSTQVMKLNDEKQQVIQEKRCYPSGITDTKRTHRLCFTCC
ncbi:MAG: hypothetical protein R2911_42670 [Caldilineaceae bacterium]